MSTLTVTTQKPGDKLWRDEQGQVIPYARTTPYERKAETTISKLAKEALAINAKQVTFKNEIMAAFEVLYAEFLKTNAAPANKGKGNRTFYNFDKSIKITIDVNEPIRFDEEYIRLAKDELDTMLNEELGETAGWLKGVITDAFEKSRGELDTDKVLSLKKHASRTDNARFHKAMGYIDKAINRPTSKAYPRVWVRDENGQFQNVQLNFSAL